MIHFSFCLIANFFWAWARLCLSLFLYIYFRSLSDSLRAQLLETIKHTFHFNQQQAESLYHDIMQCMKKKQLVRIFIAQNF